MFYCKCFLNDDLSKNTFSTLNYSHLKIKRSSNAHDKQNSSTIKENGGSENVKEQLINYTSSINNNCP